MTVDTIWMLIESTAMDYNINPDTLLALCSVESSLDTWAHNPEPQYRYLWDVRLGKPFRALTAGEIISEKPPTDFHSLAGDADQEWWNQQASWGLMQVMGAVAREHGFVGSYLTRLCDPAVGLEFGCRHLSANLRWANGNYTQALAAYNGGRGGNERPPYRNIVYAEKVLRWKRGILA